METWNINKDSCILNRNTEKMDQATSFLNEAKGMFKVSWCQALWHEFVCKQIKQKQWNESKKHPPTQRTSITWNILM